MTREIATKWHAMSKDEQEAATADTMKELQERKEGHAKGTHTVPVQAFNDTRATLATLQREVSRAASLPQLCRWSLMYSFTTDPGPQRTYRYRDPLDRRSVRYIFLQPAVLLCDQHAPIRIHQGHHAEHDLAVRVADGGLLRVGDGRYVRRYIFVSSNQV